MKLFEIGAEAIAIQDALYESIGELTPEIQQRIDTLLSEGADNMVAAAWIVTQLEADAELCKAEAARLKERAATIERNSESLKARMVFAVDSAFNGKLKTATRTIWAQNAAATLTIELAPDADLTKLELTDSEFVKKTLALNTTAIRNRFSAGDPIPSAITVKENPPTRYLRIK